MASILARKSLSALCTRQLAISGPALRDSPLYAARSSPVNGIGGLRSLATTTGRTPKAGASVSAPVKIKEGHRALTLNVGKTAGRNSAGRITSYHRGGGAKRLHRRIDIKRDTSSIGVVERIEYDPNRSSRIALVRWVEGGRYSPPKFKEPKELLHQFGTAEPITTASQAKYTLSSMARNVDQRTVACCSPVTAKSLVVGHHPTSTSFLKGTSVQRSSVRDIFLAAFSRNQKGKGESFPSESYQTLPRIAVVGAQPNFFAPQSREEAEGKTAFAISEIKYNKQSSTWDNRNKRKAAIPWQSCTL
ncbi:60S ribosomal protein L2, mitochondrial [Linum perenne]